MTSDVVPSTEGDRRRSKHPVQWSDGDVSAAAAAAAAAEHKQQSLHSEQLTL